MSRLTARINGSIVVSTDLEGSGVRQMVRRPLELSRDIRSCSSYTEQVYELVLSEDPSYDTMPIPSEGRCLAVMVTCKDDSIVNLRLTRDSGVETVTNVVGSFLQQTPTTDPFTAVEIQRVRTGRVDYLVLVAS